MSRFQPGDARPDWRSGHTMAQTRYPVAAVQAVTGLRPAPACRCPWTTVNRPTVPPCQDGFCGGLFFRVFPSPSSSGVMPLTPG